MSGSIAPGFQRGLAIIIPAFRAERTIVGVVLEALRYAELVIAVDDCCPQNSGDSLDANVKSDRVVVLRHDVNRGVGGAVKTGIAYALAAKMRYIVKVDADDQMDQRYIPYMIEILEQNEDVDLVKGNRFADAGTVRSMPPLRLVGNSGLSFLVKLSSGYWGVVDPTNGFVALRASTIGTLGYESLAERYFFEIDLLCELGVRHRVIAEVEMPAIYGSGGSSLSISRTLLTFPGKLLRRFLRRIVFNYLIVEINVGSIYAFLGIPLLIFGIAYGGVEWYRSSVTAIPRTTGTIILSLLLFMTGFQLTLQALTFDVQSATRVIKRRLQIFEPRA